MKCLIPRNHKETTVRKVTNDEKTKVLGIVGTVEDLWKAEIIEWSDYPAKTWLFIPAPKTGLKDRAGDTKLEALRHLIEAGW